MNSEQRLALLEAFAKSKQYEFNGFTVKWFEEHPEPVEPTVEVTVAEEANLPEVEVAEDASA